MVSILSETVLTLVQAADRLPGSKGCDHPDPATLTRWILRGVKTPAGRVRLEAAKLPSGWRTSAQAVDRFLAALNPADEPSTRRNRTRPGEAAGRRLQAMGL
jgi:hypothetical protein